MVWILFFESFSMATDFRLFKGLTTALIQFFVRSSFFNEVNWLKAWTGMDVSLFRLSFNDCTEVRLAKAFGPMYEILLLLRNRYCKDSLFVTFCDGMDVILLWCKDKRIKEDGKACHGGTSLSRFSWRRSSWRSVSLESCEIFKVTSWLLLRSNEVVCKGIPSGIERSWRLLQITLVPEQMQGLAVTHSWPFWSCPSDNPHKAKHIAIKAFIILIDAIFDWNPRCFYISHHSLY